LKSLRFSASPQTSPKTRKHAQRWPSCWKSWYDCWSSIPLCWYFVSNKSARNRTEEPHALN
jgi:hypothetical protein